jgi:hypothetical protein
MDRPTKTVLELMELIKSEAASDIPWPSTAQLTIWPSGKTWKVGFHSRDPTKDEAFARRVASIAESLAKKFDLERVTFPESPRDTRIREVRELASQIVGGAIKS